MSNWHDNTGFWQDGVESSTLTVGQYRAHVREEGEHEWHWIVNLAIVGDGMQRVDQGTAPTAAWAQYHAEKRIAWSAKALGIQTDIEPHKPTLETAS